MRMLAKKVYHHLPFKRPVFEWMRSRVSLPSSVYQHLHFEGPFAVRIDNDHAFRMHSEGAKVENDLFWGGYGKSWEGMSLNVWAAMCRGAEGLILDIGANTGTYALAAKALAPRAEVLAFEPLARVAAKIRTNVSLNDFEVTVVEAAVSDHSGTLPIFDLPVAHNYSASLEGQGPDAHSYDVPVRSIDDVLADRPAATVSAIKIDVERHEPAALRGMVRTLAAHRPPVLIEILDSTIGQQCSDVLRDIGYDRYVVLEESGLQPTETLSPSGGHDWNHLLCTAKDFERLGLNRFLAPKS